MTVFPVVIPAETCVYTCSICLHEKEKKKRDDFYIVRFSRLMESSFLNIRSEFEEMLFVQVVKKIVNYLYSISANPSWLTISCLFLL